MYVIKRNKSEVEFDTNKIINAITKANNSVNESERLTSDEINTIAHDIENNAGNLQHSLNVEEIQDMVEDHINKLAKYKLARSYSQYRFKRAELRKRNTTDATIISLVNYQNEDVKQENSNKNPKIASVQRDYIAGEVSKDISNRLLLPSDIVESNNEGIIHFHDEDYFITRTSNCCLVNLKDMLENGTVINGTLIEKPHSFRTACNIMTQVMAQVASSQYGGQSMSLSHIAPFVDISRQRILKDVCDDLDISTEKEYLNNKNKIDKIVKKRIQREIVDGVQMLQYQAITLQTTNGQTPFVTLFMYIDEVPEGQTRDDLILVIEEVLRQRIIGVKNEKGIWITPAFPKLIYVLEEDNINPDSKYYSTTVLAAKCSAKRLVPDYISEKKMKELKDGYCFPAMGCRSMLTSEPQIVDEDGNRKFYGRFNQGVVTINLPDVALSARKKVDDEGILKSGTEEYMNKSIEVFWDILEERLELCHRALRCRHERLLGTPSDVAPIFWQHGAIARLKPGEKIDKLLFNGYSTISLGYAGLYECVFALTGKSHTDPSTTGFAKNIMEALNAKTKQWRVAENIAYSIYGSPIESTTYKFAKCLKKRFGIIPGVTDHNYITNSYHVNVREKIDAFSKLAFEAPFQELSPGGAISYVETPNMQNNIDAVLTVMRFIYDNIVYAELNTKSDYCHECGYDGEIKIVNDENGKLIWKCPNCGNTDQSKMNVARRTCGYIGSQYWNQGRTEEIRDRFVHLDNFKYEKG